MQNCQPAAGAHVQGRLENTVPAGTFVRVALRGVPAAAAAAVMARVSRYLLGDAPPLSTFALHRHEAKLSVVHLAVTRTGGYDGPLANKDELVVHLGTRRFLARPVAAADAYQADKAKLERFLHAGRTYVLSVYAPICFPPLPALLMKKARDAWAELLLAGARGFCILLPSCP